VILLDTHVMVWLALLASLPAVRLLALDAGVAVAATRLPEPFHADPADRLLVAQARALAIPLLSADNKIAPMQACAACGGGGLLAGAGVRRGEMPSFAEKL
jgi:predicted nucleic acid-binding protein